MKRILLIISGSIAAYKALELIRRGREVGYDFTGILTGGGAQFITPLSVASLSGNPCYTDLFSLKDEAEMGHIRLSRECDAVLVVPASADLMAKMVQGRCDDLASTVLLATDKPVIIAPGMNRYMWSHAATQRNIQQLLEDGVRIIQPEEGELACGEHGTGRMADVPTILDYLEQFFDIGKPLAGKHAIVTSGPTYEAIDPVRFIGNRSSGKQGHAIANKLAEAGACVTLISGPTHAPLPIGVETINVESAEEMLAATQHALPADIAICAAAVSDWRVSDTHKEKLKKSSVGAAPELQLIETPDILAWLSKESDGRPELVVGFAAETENLKEHATAKRNRKGCDWLLANDVSKGVFGAQENEILFIDDTGAEPWPRMHKETVAGKLVEKIMEYYDHTTKGNNTIQSA